MIDPGLKLLPPRVRTPLARKPRARRHAIEVAASEMARSRDGAGPRLHEARPALHEAGLAPAVRFGWHDFARIRELLRETAGIALNHEKKAMVYARLVTRVRRLGLSSFTDYVRLLEDRSHPEWDAFISALTTNLTAFFREPHHFPILAELARRRPRNQPFNVWSAGCATGEEPYSIAMCLAETYGRLDLPVRVIATDIDNRVLARARAGVFALEAVAKLPGPTMRRFFLRGSGAQAGKVKVRPELAQLVAFSSLNLCEQRWDLPGEFDAIFCRNVMIYLDAPVQRSVLEGFSARLARHGLLFTGHSENLFFTASDLFRLRGKTVYELAARPTRPA